MRGLAFPTDPTYQREYSNECGTPLESPQDIPIDPALAGPIIDPAILAQDASWNSGKQNSLHHEPIQHQHQQSSTSQYHTQYSPGPQGDPFAPQPPPIFVPDSNNPPIPKPLKRKRRPRREEECGFCQGNDSKNKAGLPEPMVTCVECGRSGHPTCMDLREVASVVRSYPWSCIECKTCEICHEKGDDERILFCDHCDRGWHMDCLLPPLRESPPGKWHCPLCPPPEVHYPSSEPPEQDPTRRHLRETSVASTSYSHDMSAHFSVRRKGKSKVMFNDDSEVDSPGSKRGGRDGRSKGKGRGWVTDTEQEDTVDPVTRSIKRMKLKLSSTPPQRMVVRLRLPPHRKGKEREEEEPQKTMFEDILSAEDRDVTRTVVEPGDKSRYEKSRAAAEIKLFPPNPVPPTPITEPDFPLPGPSSRPLRSSALHNYSTVQLPSTPGPIGSPAPSTPGAGQPVKSLQSSSTAALRIRTIRFGEYDIQTWYDAPFPEEYANLPDGRLWLCEFCLKYMRSQFLSVRHRTKCKMRHPPGDEIYRDGTVSVFEVDGRKNKIYCQNLCLLSKMFLDHKSLFYDVEPFLFYVITETDDIGARFVGYFSKEKRSPKDYNVSCIMTLPVRQRKGWGNLLIDFSYLLSKKERRVGSPEKPLSSLGALGYKNYWTLAVMRYLVTGPNKIRLEDISTATCMTIEDTCATLAQQGMFINRDATPPTPQVKPSPGQSIKITRGRKNGIARRHLQRKQTNDEERSDSPFVAPKNYEITWDEAMVRAYLDKWDAKGYLKLKPERLKWSPFILVRTKKTETLDLPLPNTTDGPDEGQTSKNGNFISMIPQIETSPAASIRENSLSLQADPVAPITEQTLHTQTQEITQVEQDRALAFKLANATPAPITRLRSQDNYNPLIKKRLESPRINGGANSPRRSRSQSAKSANTPAASFEEDEALAAKLASEESRPKRTLRSRSSTVAAQDLKRTASNVSSKAYTPTRKRRRVDSSPELESPILQVVELGNEKLDGDTHAGSKVIFDSVSAGYEVKENALNGTNGHIVFTVLDNVTDPKESLISEFPVSSQVEAPKDEIEELDLDMGTPLTALTSRMSDFGDENDPLAVTLDEVVKGEEKDFMTIQADNLGDEDAEGEPDYEVDYT